MIYIDAPPHIPEWSHLFADSIPELHAFARKMYIGRHRYENKKGRHQPHYDVPRARLQEFMDAGANLIRWRESPTLLKSIYNPEPDKTYILFIGGQTVRVRAEKQPSKQTIDALEALVRAVKKMRK